MAMKSDIQIAQETKMLPIAVVAENFGINPAFLDLYGNYKAKINDDLYTSLQDKKDGKLVLVTAINPTPAGEGKTTITIGLTQALNLLGKKTMVALREPSLGPCMGIKGGAAGGGYAQVVPMEDINLHFTGDLHAITAANNLLSAMIDNHIHQGNVLQIDPRQITWKRTIDMNDRALRNTIVGLGGRNNSMPREDCFQITVASEIMAIVCLSDDLADLKERLGNIIIGYNFTNQPVTARELSANGAMAALLKETIKPNLVQTLEHTPAIIHGGPFANIAHGCNSVRATKLALKLAEITLTEAGFGADLGAEKFFDIKCRKAGLKPDAAVLVATIRALKHNGGVKKEDLSIENTDAVRKGIENLKKHISNLQKFNVPVVCTLNSFTTDTVSERDIVREACKEMNAAFAVAEVWEKGGSGGTELAQKLIETLNDKPSNFKVLYKLDMPVKEKIEKICKEIYGAGSVKFLQKAKNNITRITNMGYDNLPVCMVKTQYSLSDDPKLLGCPKDFEVNVCEVNISAGAGFLVVLTGEIITMPGLPKFPSAEKIDIDNQGNISGLF